MKFKKMLSVILVFAMLLSMAPVSVFAEAYDPVAGLAALGEFTPPEVSGTVEVAAGTEGTDSTVSDSALADETVVTYEVADDADVMDEAPVEEPEDDGKLRVRTVDGSLTVTIDGYAEAESAVPAELSELINGQAKPVENVDQTHKLYLRSPDAEGR